jgi:hypothetical protein
VCATATILGQQAECQLSSTGERKAEFALAATNLLVLGMDCAVGLAGDDRPLAVLELLFG